MRTGAKASDLTFLYRSLGTDGDAETAAILVEKERKLSRDDTTAKNVQKAILTYNSSTIFSNAAFSSLCFTVPFQRISVQNRLGSKQWRNTRRGVIG
ncbi:hypothetical protein [Fowl aviadenovirus C]|nr:hypothetical protein [Fowl aviadenovirus C]